MDKILRIQYLQLKNMNNKGMKKYVYTLMMVVLLLSSCNSKKTYYPNGNMKEEYKVNRNKKNGTYLSYYETGKIKERHLFNLDINVDSSLFYRDNEENSIEKKLKYLINDTVLVQKFFESGILKSEGKKIYNKKINYWKYYHPTGQLSDYLEYLNIDKKEYLNNRISYNVKGDTVFNKSNFYILKTVKDTFKTNQLIRFNLFLVAPLFSNDSEVLAFIPKNALSDFDLNFSNFENIEVDTIINFKNDGITHKNFSDDAPLNRVIGFDLSFSKTGNKNVRGYIEEKNENTSRLLFFNKMIVIE
jgi:antitoxin component YwqK of YwqJK toxin-antitoxin module